MPTFGWIREDDIEAFLFGTEPPPIPLKPYEPTFHCPFCSDYFDNRRALQDHIADSHRVERPVILFEGKELSGQSTIRSGISSSKIVVSNATRASLRLNGGNVEDVSILEIPDRLSGVRYGEFLLNLTNDVEVNASPVQSEYRLSMRVASIEELSAVDHAFFDTIMSGPISRDAVGRFLADDRSQDSSAEYATGLAEYVLGVLLKERPETEAMTTPFSRYREAYGSALERLADFERPLARLVSDIIRFAMNDFSRTTSSTGFWELDLANAMLKTPEANDFTPPESENVARSSICPIDHGTDRVLDLAVRMGRQTRWSPILDDECREFAGSEILDAMDRQKALAIWAISAMNLSAFQSASEPLKQISATYPFSAWAEPWLERITE